MKAGDVKEHDVIKTTVDGINAMVGKSLPLGTQGTIVHLFPSPATGCYVEFPCLLPEDDPVIFVLFDQIDRA